MVARPPAPPLHVSLSQFHAFNPLTNLGLFRSLPPPQQQAIVAAAPAAIALNPAIAPHASAVLSQAPGAVMNLAQVPNLPGAPALPSSGAGASNLGSNFYPAPGNTNFEGWENSQMLNPILGVKRKPWPVHILPATAVTDANGNATMTWTPQEDFQAFLLTFPSTITTQGYLTQLVVGTRLVNVASGKMPIECFGEKNDARRMDFPFAKTAQQIAATIAGGPASTTIYGVLLGYGVGSAARYPVSAARMGILPLGTTSLASGSTTTITVTPQERFKPRRVILNSQAALFSNLIITGFQIGTLVQAAATANYPASVYSDLAVDDWVDFDACPKNSNIAITVNNTSTATTSGVFEGFIIGDVWYDGETSDLQAA